MPPLTTASLATEILQSTLLTLDEMGTSITVLALNASQNPEQSPRVRDLLEDLVMLIHQCECELGIYDNAEFLPNS